MMQCSSSLVFGEAWKFHCLPSTSHGVQKSSFGLVAKEAQFRHQTMRRRTEAGARVRVAIECTYCYFLNGFGRRIVVRRENFRSRPKMCYINHITVGWFWRWLVQKGLERVVEASSIF
jgi:hypothetical protein